MSRDSVNPPPARLPDSDELPPGASISRNTALSMAARLGSGLFTAVLTVFLARVLGAEEFGVFSLALGIGTVLVLPADFGISNATTRFVAERRHSRSAVADVLGTAIRLKLMLSGAVCVGLFALAGPIESAYDVSGLAWAIRGMAIAVFAQSMMLLYMGVADALTRVALSFRILVSESAVEFGASLALVLAGFGAAGAAFGRATGYAIGAGLGVIVIGRALGRPRAIPEDQQVGAKRLMGYGGALLVIDGAFTLFQQLNTLLIGAMLSTTAVGLFQAPMRLIGFLHYPGIALATGVAPRLARNPEHAPEIEPFRRAIRYLILLQAFVTVVAVVWAEPLIVLLLGSEFEDAAGVLRALGPFIFLTGFAALFSLAVNYLGEARRRVPIAIGTLVINLVLSLLLIPKIGIEGGAIGTDVAFMLYVPGHLWVCHRLIDLPLRPLGVSLLRAGLAAAGAGGLLALFGTSEVAPPLMLVGGACALAVYIALLVALRELRSADLQQVRSRLSGLGRTR